MLAVDDCFLKERFLKAVTGAGLTVITKARKDANMYYVYKGPQHKGPGRKKMYDDKVNWQTIDKRRFRLCCQDEELTAREAVVWRVALKPHVKVVYVKARERKGYGALVCTDTEMQGEKVLRYYRLRFQIEFLLRDAKAHAGLEHCQARSEGKRYNHFNMALLSVSVVKQQTWAQRLDIEDGQRKGFIATAGGDRMTILPDKDNASNIEEIGLTHKQSSTFQQIAPIPEDDFEAFPEEKKPSREQCNS